MEFAAPSPHVPAQGSEVVSALAAALKQAGEPPAVVRETHMSWVLLTADRAYKLKKPVLFGFVDLSTPQLRREACEEEVRVNQELAAGVVLGVRGLVLLHGAYALADGPSDEAVDWVVEMRRFDEQRTMVALLERGELTADQVGAVGWRLAEFHRRARRYGPAEATPVVELVKRNLAELRPLCVGFVPSARLRAAERFAIAFSKARSADLAARLAEGLVRDGHGDLRAEHVLLEGDHVVVVDRLEFDPALRAVDVGDDLAFLVMDLEGRGATWAAERLIASYREAGGDPGDDALVAFFAAYRAQVRAKVELLRAGQLASDGAEEARRRARRLLALGEHFAWRGREPLLLAVTGPPASGKSTLAHALGQAGGLPVLSSDALRKRQLGVRAAAPAPASAYAPDARASVYRELGRRAQLAWGSGGAILDATFGDTVARDAFFAALTPEAASSLLVIGLRAPPTVLVERARRRAQDDNDASDAGPDVAARLARSFTPFGGSPGHRLALDGEVAVDELVERVVAWLDERLACADPHPGPTT